MAVVNSSSTATAEAKETTTDNDSSRHHHQPGRKENFSGGSSIRDNNTDLSELEGRVRELEIQTRSVVPGGRANTASCKGCGLTVTVDKDGEGCSNPVSPVSQTANAAIEGFLQQGDDLVDQLFLELEEQEAAYCSPGISCGNNNKNNERKLLTNGEKGSIDNSSSSSMTNRMKQFADTWLMTCFNGNCGSKKNPKHGPKLLQNNEEDNKKKKKNDVVSDNKVDVNVDNNNDDDDVVVDDDDNLSDAAAAAASAGCRCPVGTGSFLQDDDLSKIVPELLKDISQQQQLSNNANDEPVSSPSMGSTRTTGTATSASKNRLRTIALQKLQQMTDRERKHNRVPLVCTTKYNVTAALLPCLSPSASAPDRRKALLILANLSIPMENKAVMLLQPQPLQQTALEVQEQEQGEDADDDLLSALLRILHLRLGETYLAAACLFNLSFLEEAKARMLTWKCRHYDEIQDTNDESSGRSTTTMIPPDSCLAIIESLLIEYTPFLFSDGKDGKNSSQPSVQGETVRWCMGAVRNMVAVPENARLVAATRIPELAASCLNASTRDLGLWTSRDSLEDASLMLLVHGCSTTSMPNLLAVLRPALTKIQGQGGIHEVRATALLQQLEQQQQERANFEEKKEPEDSTTAYALIHRSAEAI